MALIIHVRGARAQWWLETLQGLLPELDCRPWQTPGNPADIDIAVVWKPPVGGLRQFPNLRGIFSIGAGVDHVFADPQLPEDVPVFRLTGVDLAQRMREYVALHVLRYHRTLPAIEAQRAERAWDQPITPLAGERTVGILGLGHLGGACARTLVGLGFRVRGWTRSPRSLEGVEVFAGDGQRPAFLAGCEILVCLLPLTPATTGILDKALFTALPRGAFLINCARGQHLVEADLLAALDSGHLAGATLDVFHQEPLPTDHPFWTHPAITITPHTASLIDPLVGGRLLAANIRRFLAGETLDEQVDPAQGY